MSKFSIRIAVGAVVSAMLAVPLVVLPAVSASAAEAPVGLGVLAEYAVLGGETVTNTGPSVVGGSLGVAPGTAITGFAGGPGSVVGGTIYTPPASNAARAAATTAYLDAAGRSGGTILAVELGGQTLVSGLYTAGPSGTFGITGPLTLSGDVDDVWIFQTSETLITAAASSVILTGGAQACNVFWKIGSSATLGASSAFSGTILAAATISVGNGADIVGRLIAGTGEVTLINDTITRSDCATVEDETEAGAAADVADDAADEAADAEADAAEAAADAAEAAAIAAAATTSGAAGAAAEDATDAAERAADAADAASEAAEDAAEAADDTVGTSYEIGAAVDAAAAANSADRAADSAIAAAASRDQALTRAGLTLAATGVSPPSPLLALVMLLIGGGLVLGVRLRLRR